MKKSELFAVLAIAGLSLTGCISSTTGAIGPESDSDDAAEYNYQLGARYYQSQSYDLARDRLERAIGPLFFLVPDALVDNDARISVR